jgi:hypothetical protein
VKRFPHTPHWCGFSPLWMRLCVFSELDVLNPLPQTSQTWGFSPVGRDNDTKIEPISNTLQLYGIYEIISGD